MSPETKSHLSKTRKSLFLPSLSLSLSWIRVIDELWPNRRLTSRTSRGKKMNGVDTIRLREETTSISCYEYESVHHSMKEKPTKKEESERKRIKKKEFSLRISFYNCPIVYLCCFYSKKKQFLFWELLWLPSLFIEKILSVTHALDKWVSLRQIKCISWG
jgi:hypothetical protein